jgi:hypothetical protein
MASEFQLGDQFNITLQVSGNEHGTIKLNTITPKVYPFTGIYFENIPIKMTAISKPGYRFVRWEGTVQSAEATISYNMNSPGTFKAVFTEALVEDLSLVINEINYSSSDARNTKDWVELYNNGSTSVDLNGWLLIDADDDSGFVFQPGTVMAPGSYLVVCRDLNDFRTFYPAVNNAVGDMLCGLSSEGDIVRLFDHNRELIDAVNYGPIEPWPDSANGTGATLELKSPGMNNALPASWHSVGATPGKVNTYYEVPVSTGFSEDIMVFECFPNPFRDFTTISFNVEVPGHYKLEVIDNHGSVIKVLANHYLSTGLYWIDWTGEGAQAGVFTIRLTGEQTSKTLKVVKLR